MERLTKRLDSGETIYYLHGFGAFDEIEALSECIDRLAAYEDTMPLDRVQELAQAEKDGRLFVTPCKIGDYVFDISHGVPYETRVLSFFCHEDGWSVRTVSSFPDLMEFGTRIFLSLEEAEAALEKREADNEAD